MNDLYVYHKGKKLRCGYTTGSCATAAAKASAVMLHNQKLIEKIEISTPANTLLLLTVKNPHFDRGTASCSIIKDAGDDHDSTDGMRLLLKLKKEMTVKLSLKEDQELEESLNPVFGGSQEQQQLIRYRDK